MPMPTTFTVYVTSLKGCEKVLMTKATRDLTETLNESLKLKDSPAVKTLEYGKVLKYKDEKISFIKADHILGAARFWLRMQAEYESFGRAISGWMERQS